MDYKNGKSYKILNTVNDDCYIGSTCQKLCQRMAKHRSVMNAKNKQHYKLYQSMREIGSDKFYIELIKEYPCENVGQLRAVEGEYIRQMGTLNNRIEARTKHEYTNDTKERKREYDKQRRRSKREELNQQKREYYYENKEECNKRNKESYYRNREVRLQKNKDYNEQHKEEVNQYQKEWGKQNRENNSQLVECEICGSIYKAYIKRHHIKTKKHQEALNNLNNINNVSSESNNIRANGKETEG